MEHIIAAAECWMKHLRNMASEIEVEIQHYRTQRKMEALKKQQPVENKRQRHGRDLSPAARERIAAAQRKRWDEHRKRKAQG